MTKDYRDALQFSGLWLLLVSIMYLLRLWLIADGSADYCYIERDLIAPALYQHRPWRLDHELDRFDSIQEAVDAAHKLNCPLR